MKKLNLSIFYLLCFICAGSIFGQDGRITRIAPSGGSQNPASSIVKIIAGNFDADRNFIRNEAGSGVIIDSRGIIVTARHVVFPKNSTVKYPEIPGEVHYDQIRLIGCG